MIDDPKTPETSFLRRWSQRKLAAARETSAPAPAPPVASAPAPAVAPSEVASSPQTSANATGPALPPVDALTFESDFTAFLQPRVAATVKREALRKLFADPRFNVMDGLDVYIDDYSKSEPIPPELLKQLRQARYLFDPPKTRVNEQGVVEDVPDEPVAQVEAECGDVPRDADASAPARESPADAGGAAAGTGSAAQQPDRSAIAAAEPAGPAEPVPADAPPPPASATTR